MLIILIFLARVIILANNRVIHPGLGAFFINFFFLALLLFLFFEFIINVILASDYVELPTLWLDVLESVIGRKPQVPVFIVEAREGLIVYWIVDVANWSSNL